MECEKVGCENETLVGEKWRKYITAVGKQGSQKGNQNRTDERFLLLNTFFGVN